MKKARVSKNDLAYQKSKIGFSNKKLPKTVISLHWWYLLEFNWESGGIALGLINVKKYSNKLSMKALVEKDILMKNKKKRWRRLYVFLYVHLSWEFKGTQGNSRGL